MIQEELEIGILAEPANKAEREKCERAQVYLRAPMDQDWPLPSYIEETDYGVAKVWYVYEDTWPGDDSPDFEFCLCIPIYVVWGRKKREAYLKNRKDKS